MNAKDKMSFNISKSVYDELKEIADEEETEIELVIKKCLKIYHEQNNKKKYLYEQMKKGYEESGEINLGLAEMCLEADNQALELIEQFLTESE